MFAHVIFSVALLESGQTPETVLARPRSLLSADATIEILKKRPLKDAIAVVDQLFKHAHQGHQARQSFIHLAGKIMYGLGVGPSGQIDPFPITMLEYSAIAPAFGITRQPLCPVHIGMSQTITREYSLFYQWHIAEWCGVGTIDPVPFYPMSSILVRKFCRTMVFIALNTAGRTRFPAELVEIIARFLL